MTDRDDERIVRAVSESTGEVIRQALKERDARLDYIERQLAIDKRYQAVVGHPLWSLALEAMATGEEDRWQMASDLNCTVPELEWAIERWKRSWRR